MKLFFTIYILLMFASSTLIAQTIWTKDLLNNPVLGPGQSGSWDDQGAGMCTVLLEDTIYHMWYTGYNGSTTLPVLRTVIELNHDIRVRPPY